MKADLSRDTFERSKHYRRVLEQQGRVVIDADSNEQTSIAIATAETTAFDVIGPSGVPETTLSFGYNGGFEIGIGGDPNDLTIAHGRMYVDGLLVENDADTTLATQPFLHWNQADLSATGVTGPGLYGVYLDAWERLVTAIDDPSIRETALGGPDTSARSEIAWQVKLGAIDTTEFGDNPPCAQILDPWNANSDPGSLGAQGGAPSTDPGPCVLPPQTGFRSLENQLYRVEIHTAGRYGTATFKWSRENGSVVAGITSKLSGAFASPTFSVQSVGRDSSLGFAHGEWVELIDDRSELTAGVGQLLQVDQVPDQMTISLQASPALTVDASLHPKLRRWDQSAGATASGVTIAGGNWIDLENGVQIRFADGFYDVGDYWLIPARTATSQQTTGTVEWPLDPTTGEPAFEAPRGVRHYYAKLAIVAYDGTRFAPPAGGSAVTDCRAFFPPLTALVKQQGPCTIVVQPGANWTAQITALFAGHPALDAEICFPVGEFSTPNAVEIVTRGNVKVTGAGWGTKLFGQGETVLRFKGCTSVSVCDLEATSSRVDDPSEDPLKPPNQRINGTLDFENCSEVRVEGVLLRCGGERRRGAACLTVRSKVGAGNVSTGAGTARIYDSKFVVGEMQYGVLLVHQRRAFVERNEISVSGAKKKFSFTDALRNDPLLVRSFESIVLNGMQTSSTTGERIASVDWGKAFTKSHSSSSSHSDSSSSSDSTALSAREERARLLAEQHPTTVEPIKGLLRNARKRRTTSRTPNTRVSYRGAYVMFNTVPALHDFWQQVVDTDQPEVASNSDLANYLRALARRLLTDPELRRRFPEVRDFLQLVERHHVALGLRGITVGGQGLSELRVRDNVIYGLMQGIVVGLSHRESRPQKPDVAGTVTISGNAVRVALSPARGYVHARYGIFAGNVESLQIENNTVELKPLAGFALPVDGIRVFGYLGRKVILRHNHVREFTRGAVVVALARPGNDLSIQKRYLADIQRGNLWLIADNIFENVATAIETDVCMKTGNMIWNSGEQGSAP